MILLAVGLAVALIVIQAAQATVSSGSVTVVAANDVAGQANADYDVAFDTDITDTTNTITVTFPAGFTITDGALTAAAVQSGGATASNIHINAMDASVEGVAGDAGNRTITVTLDAAADLSAGDRVAFRILTGVTNPTAIGATANTFEIDTGEAGETAQTGIAGVTIVHAAASQIKVTQEPTTAVAGVAFAQQPIVQVQDQFGNIVTTGADATQDIVASLQIGSGVLTTTLTVATGGDGQADFAGLKIDLIGADKVIRVTTTIAAGEVTDDSAVVTINATAGLGGTLSDNAAEAELRTAGQTLTITLVGDTWVAEVGTAHASTTALIAGLDSNGMVAAGWDAVVKAGMSDAHVVRTNATVVTITLPAFANFDITALETITVTIPAIALTQSGVGVAAGTTFDINFTELLGGGPGNNADDDDMDMGTTDGVLVLEETVVLADAADENGNVVVNTMIEADENGSAATVEITIPVDAVTDDTITVSVTDFGSDEIMMSTSAPPPVRSWSAAALSTSRSPTTWATRSRSSTPPPRSNSRSISGAPRPRRSRSSSSIRRSANGYRSWPRSPRTAPSISASITSRSSQSSKWVR